MQTHRAFSATYKFEDLPKLVVAFGQMWAEAGSQASQFACDETGGSSLLWHAPGRAKKRKEKRNVARMEADKIKNFLIYSFFIANNSTLLALPICGPPVRHSLQIT